MDHRRKIDDSDLIVLVAPIWNYRMPAIVEGWIDKVLAPPWAFSFKKLFGNYGYAVGKLKSKKALIFCTYGSPRFSISDFFLNLPLRRIKKGIFLNSLPSIDKSSINLLLKWENVDIDLVINENGCKISSKKSNYFLLT